MRDLEGCIAALWGKNASSGYAALQELLAESRESAAVYAYFNQFLEQLSSTNSYFRTRALALIVANAKWDTDYLIDGSIGPVLAHITDPKPVTARKFVQDLPALAAAKPDLREDILRALSRADTLRYPLSMRPLVEQDIRNAVEAIEAQGRAI